MEYFIWLLKDILWPKKCYSCKKEWHFFCRQCLSKIQKYEDKCYLCKKQTKDFVLHTKCRQLVYFDQVIILSHYKEKIIKKLIKDWKFYWKKDIFEELWLYLYELFKSIYKDIKNKQDYIVVSSPMSFFRKLKRWYNQSYILAKSFSNHSGIYYEKNLINKTINTRQQSKLNKLDRMKNLKKSFKINDKYIDMIDNKTIIFIDDVISTWTTLNEISKVLKKSWAKKIIWLIVASD